MGLVAVVFGPLFGLLAAMRVAPSLFLVRSCFFFELMGDCLVVCLWLVAGPSVFWKS